MNKQQGFLLFLILATAVVSLFIVLPFLQYVLAGIIFAYVLYPLRQRLVDRGLSRRVASALVTATAFLAVVVLFAPVLWALVRRRESIVSLLRNLPDSLPVEAAGFTYVVDVASLSEGVTASLRAFALDLAANAVFIVLELAMFALVLYGLLLRPGAVGDAVYGIVPTEYHDVIRRLNDRISGTLYALYVIQAATAVLTFPVAFVVFYALGYGDAFVLSVIAAIFQFIPVLGPGVLALALAAGDFLLGSTQRAVVVAVLGPVVIGLLPDLVVRPQLASRQAKLPVSLYFVGFTGGVLTVGVIGVIVGPLAVAVLVETVELLGGDTASA